MSELLDRVSTKRLMAYSAAAGMGAFAFGQSADAALQVNMSQNGVSYSHSGIAQNGDDFTVDININEFATGGVATGDGSNDVRLGVFLNSIGMNPFPGNTVLVDSPDTAGSSYYVTGFADGTTVDGSREDAGGGINLAFVSFYSVLYSPGYFLQYNHTSGGEWVGVQFDIGGNTHFGAIQILDIGGFGAADTNGNGIKNDLGDVSPGPTVNITIGAILWDDTPGVAVVTPEPASLGLLAMGAGALGLRRRRQA